MSTYFPIINRNELDKTKIKVVNIAEKDIALLFINNNGNFHLIENKCGHFGMALDDGKIELDRITCVHHGIAFSLESGENVNRPWEDCEKVKVFELVEKQDQLGVML